MSSSSMPGLPPPSIVYGIAAAAFNASLFTVMLLGIYSLIYMYTMYVYLSRKGISKGNAAILATITVLFLINIALTAASWITTRAAFLGIIGQPIDDVFFIINAALGDNWDVLLNDCGNLLLICLADGLQIWRCYHVWGESIYVVALPIAFLLAETALYLSVIIIACINDLNPPSNVALLINHLTSAALFMTLGSTLITTSLIAYRIFSVSQSSKPNLLRGRLISILDAVVQSAATYTAVSLLVAIEGVIPNTSSNTFTLFNLQGYTFPLFATTAGAAPTVMIARVALLSPPSEVTDTKHRISDLEFNGGPTSESFPSSSDGRDGIDNDKNHLH